MTKSFIHRCLAYLLIALLPWQAAAAGRLALCAENFSVSAAQTMDHCMQMNSMGDSASPDSSKTHSNGCWLGSICIASVSVMAMPGAYHFARMEQGAPIYFSTTAFYLSVVPDTPQRPPNTL